MSRMNSLLDAIANLTSKLFKLAILAFIAIFLLIFYSSTQTNRFHYVNVKDNDYSIFDSKTGAYFDFVQGNKGERPYYLRVSPFTKLERIDIEGWPLSK